MTEIFSSYVAAFKITQVNLKELKTKSFQKAPL